MHNQRFEIHSRRRQIDGVLPTSWNTSNGIFTIPANLPTFLLLVDLFPGFFFLGTRLGRRASGAGSGGNAFSQSAATFRYFGYTAMR